MPASLYKERKRGKTRRTIIAKLFRFILLLFLIWFIGLLWFVGFKPQATDIKTHTKADGIVVLTGGVGRIETGIEALTHDLAKAMLISGVNANIDSQTIFNAYDLSADNCQQNGSAQPNSSCIHLGRAALDTKGNAIEAKNWAAENGFSSLIIITSEYHMQRALLEIHRAAPEIALHPMVVVTELKWTSIALEYTKYIYSLTQHTLFS